jgi:hypothetical protein
MFGGGACGDGVVSGDVVGNVMSGGVDGCCSCGDVVFCS